MSAELSPEELATRRRQLAHPATLRVIRTAARWHVPVFRATGGRVGGRWRIGAGLRKPVPTLLLEHVGRRSARVYASPLLFLQDGDRLVIVGSQGGTPRDPQWVANLDAHPEVTVHLPNGRGRHAVRARRADADERQQLWPRLVDLYADFATYQQVAERVIPVFILDPRG